MRAIFLIGVQELSTETHLKTQKPKVLYYPFRVPRVPSLGEVVSFTDMHLGCMESMKIEEIDLLLPKNISLVYLSSHSYSADGRKKKCCPIRLNGGSYSQFLELAGQKGWVDNAKEAMAFFEKESATA